MNMWIQSGRKAMGNYATEFFKVGQPLNVCLVDASSPLLASTSFENLTSTLVYSSDSSMQQGTMVFGKRCLDPDKYSRISEQFSKTIAELKNR